MAYPNVTINEGGFGSFQASEAISIYQRCKFVAPASGDGKPQLAVAAIGERGDCIAMQPIASGAVGTVRFLNAQGEQFGLAVEAIAVGGDVYTAALGKYSTSSGGGALLVGRATCAAATGGAFSWIPKTPAA